jgi:hypothetical protein
MSIAEKLRTAQMRKRLDEAETERDAAQADVQALADQLQIEENRRHALNAKLADAEAQILDLRNANARLMLALEKAQDENARILAGDLVVGPACWECPNSLHIYKGISDSPTVVCRLKIRCRMFGKQAPSQPETVAGKLSEGWVNE